MRIFYFILIVPVLLGLACGKKNLNIGREDPEKEIQKCIRLSEKKRYEEAVECLEIFKSRFSETPLGQEAELRIADNYFQQKEYLLAADTYQAFIRLNPFHQLVPYAAYRTGLSYVREAPKAIDRDQQYLFQAIDHLEFTVRNFPNNPYAEKAQKELDTALEKVAARHLYVGRFYFRTKEYRAAIPRFEEIDRNFSNTPSHVKALYYWGISYIKLDQTEDAERIALQMRAFYPEHKLTKRLVKKLK